MWEYGIGNDGEGVFYYTLKYLEEARGTRYTTVRDLLKRMVRIRRTAPNHPSTRMANLAAGDREIPLALFRPPHSCYHRLVQTVADIWPEPT